MATTKPTSDAVPEEYDFENWDQEKEDAALRELNDVQHIIVEGSFVGRFSSDKKIVKIPLTITLDAVDELKRDFDDPIDQFKHLVRTFGGDELVAEIETRGIIPVGIMAEKYFRALQRAQELAFPES